MAKFSSMFLQLWPLVHSHFLCPSLGCYIFGMSTTTLTNFYRCTIESILSGCITAWYGSCSVQEHKKLQSFVNVAQSITQTNLPPIDAVYTSRCLAKAASLIKDPMHPGEKLFRLVPSETKMEKSEDMYQLTHRIIET